MSEALAQLIITNTLKKKYKIVVSEVPVLSRCIDIVFVNEDNEIVSIEVKLKNWRKAILQAKDHQLSVDRSYIYLPTMSDGVSSKLSGCLQGTGIGLCFFSKDNKTNRLKITEVKTAEKSMLIWENSRKKIEEIIYAESN